MSPTRFFIAAQYRGRARVLQAKLFVHYKHLFL